MKQHQIIELLHKVVAENQNFTTWTVSTPHLVALVTHAIEAEREACANLCQNMYKKWVKDKIGDIGIADPSDCANAIRARSISRGEA